VHLDERARLAGLQVVPGERVGGDVREAELAEQRVVGDVMEDAGALRLCLARDAHRGGELGVERGGGVETLVRCDHCGAPGWRDTVSAVVDGSSCRKNASDGPISTVVPRSGPVA